MYTGYNVGSKKELASQYIEYISVDFEESENDEEFFNSLTVDEVLSQIKGNEFIIEESKTRFEDID